METTTNYGLPKWVKSDQIRMDAFNDAFGKIDAQMKKNADAAANGLTAEAAARQSADAAVKNELTAAMGTTGYNCRAVMGSYTGTGKSGASNPTTIVTGFTPLVLVLCIGTTTHIRIRRAAGSFEDNDLAEGTSMMQMTWGADRVSWYSTTVKESIPHQANSSGVTYYYLVLGYDAA